MENNADFTVENPDLKKEVTKENPLKEMLVDYVGNKLKPEDNLVNVEMIINVLADEFPEFVLAVAEENFIRGYQQAVADMDKGTEEKAIEEV